MRITFADWLIEREKLQQEACTDTGDIAHFARPFIPSSRRMYPEPITFDDDEEKKKKK